MKESVYSRRNSRGARHKEDANDLEQTTIEAVSMAVGNLSFSTINSFFSSLKAPLKKDISVEKNARPVLSDCLKTLAGPSAQRAYSLIKVLDGLVKLNPTRHYQPAYWEHGAGETVALKWSVRQPRDTGPDCGRGEAYGESFLLDLMRSDYLVSNSGGAQSAGYCRLLDQACADQRLQVLEGCGLSRHDLARVSEIAHQGHLAETATEAFEHHVSDGDHLFVQHAHPTHEITVGGQEAVLITSTTAYTLKHLDTEMHVHGLVLDATVTTRIGYVSGKLDHAALGSEPTRVDYELRYVVDNPVASTARAGLPARHALKV